MLLQERLALSIHAGIGWLETLDMSVPERRAVLEVLQESMKQQSEAVEAPQQQRPLPRGALGTARLSGG